MRLSVLVLSAAAVAAVYDRWSNSEVEAKIPLTTAPGLAVPDLGQLSEKLESGLRYPHTAYTKGGQSAEVQVGKHFSAIVRSFDAWQGIAYVELTSRRYNMSLIQIWRFDGNTWSDLLRRDDRTWSDGIDPGIFIR